MATNAIKHYEREARKLKVKGIKREVGEFHQPGMLRASGLVVSLDLRIKAVSRCAMGTATSATKTDCRPLGRLLELIGVARAAWPHFQVRECL